MVVETAKVHNDVIVVKLKGIDDRDAALACKGKQMQCQGHNCQKRKRMSITGQI